MAYEAIELHNQAHQAEEKSENSLAEAKAQWEKAINLCRLVRSEEQGWKQRLVDEQAALERAREEVEQARMAAEMARTNEQKLQKELAVVLGWIETRERNAGSPLQKEHPLLERREALLESKRKASETTELLEGEARKALEEEERQRSAVNHWQAALFAVLDELADCEGESAQPPSEQGLGN